MKLRKQSHRDTGDLPKVAQLVGSNLASEPLVSIAALCCSRKLSTQNRVAAAPGIPIQSPTVPVELGCWNGAGYSLVFGRKVSFSFGTKHLE